MTEALLVSQILIWIILAGILVALVAIARQTGLLIERVAPVGALATSNGPQAGAPAPRLALVTMDGHPIVLGGDLPPGERRLLFFVSPQCPVCKKLIPIVRSFARREHLHLIFASDGTDAALRAMINAFAIADHPFINSAKLGMAYGIDKLPHAVLLDDRGVILSRGLVNSREHLESLVVADELGIASVQDYLAGRLNGERPMAGAVASRHGDNG
ncbi:methylamine utilization protein MauD [Sphingomonas oleivorans]|uniref:Methylamine utilization protein MauD n=1 Tax=Sphingomonas oleivorans TaxID=1735121 RepID=A0A2T5FZ71_9SPHN|nr:conjugal transfer protein TraF [Sphingomonas oleivorans]PTQ11888.1 methylamine utilization protein MauD [Sphingomonas oleivorans]